MALSRTRPKDTTNAILYCEVRHARLARIRASDRAQQRYRESFADWRGIFLSDDTKRAGCFAYRVPNQSSKLTQARQQMVTR